MAGKVFFDITMSLDGFIAGPNDGPDNGLGDGGDQLHQWVYGLSAWRAPHGLEGGETNNDSEILEEALAATGAVIVGRRMYDNAGGWGDDPPFKVPVFVLTHDRHDPIAKGETTFTFVGGEVDRVLQQAREAANGKDVSIGGGASTVDQFLKAGLVDELQVHVAPIFLGDGVRLFEQLGPGIELERTRVVDSPGVTHMKFRVVKG
ncbi:MAG TPA: dihydrofolate reductase family protein [Actinomycetota bacterium]|jgi:dihydrofolate reductase